MIHEGLRSFIRSCQTEIFLSSHRDFNLTIKSTMRISIVLSLFCLFLAFASPLTVNARASLTKSEPKCDEANCADKYGWGYSFCGGNPCGEEHVDYVCCRFTMYCCPWLGGRPQCIQWPINQRPPIGCH